MCDPLDVTMSSVPLRLQPAMDKFVSRFRRQQSPIASRRSAFMHDTRQTKSASTLRVAKSAVPQSVLDDTPPPAKQLKRSMRSPPSTPSALNLSQQSMSAASQDAYQLSSARNSITTLEMQLRHEQMKGVEAMQKGGMQLDEKVAQLKSAEDKIAHLTKQLAESLAVELQTKIDALTAEAAAREASIKQQRSTHAANHADALAEAEGNLIEIRRLTGEVETMLSTQRRSAVDKEEDEERLADYKEQLKITQQNLDAAHKQMAATGEEEQRLRQLLADQEQDLKQYSADGVQVKARREQLSKLDALNDSLEYTGRRCERLESSAHNYGLLLEKHRCLEHEMEVLKSSRASLLDANAVLEVKIADDANTSITAVHPDVQAMLDEKQTEIERLQCRLASVAEPGDIVDPDGQAMHMEDNPLAIARRAYSRDVDVLRTANERLTERVRALERVKTEFETKGIAAGLDVSVMMNEQLADNEKQRTIDAITQQLEKSERRCTKMQQVSNHLTQEYREICARLTGYQLKMRNDNITYDLQPQIEPNSCLSFVRDSTTDDLQLLSTPFAEQFGHLADEYLMQHHSVPMFLAAVLLQLHNEANDRREDEEESDMNDEEEEEGGLEDGEVDREEEMQHEEGEDSEFDEEVDDDNPCDSSIHQSPEELFAAPSTDRQSRGPRRPLQTLPPTVHDEGEEEYDSEATSGDEEEEEDGDDVADSTVVVDHRAGRHLQRQSSDSSIECIDL